MIDLTKLQLSEKEKEPLFVDDVFQKEVFDKMNAAYFDKTNADLAATTRSNEDAKNAALELLARSSGVAAKDIAVLFGISDKDKLAV